MAQEKGGKKRRAKARAENGDTGDQGQRQNERFDRISKSSSQIVKDAAALLDDEIASGIVAAKQVQERFRSERRIDPGDFKEALAKFQGDTHSVINLMDEQVNELRSDENAAVFSRFINNAHSLLDLTVELVNMGAEIADQLVQQSRLSKKPGSDNGNEPNHG